MYKDKKIKVILAVTKSNWGGAQKYVYDIAINLNKNIYDILVLCGGDGILAKKLSEKGIRLIIIPYLSRDINIFYEFLLFFNLTKIFYKESPDIVHLNSSKIGGLGSLTAKIAGIKKIIFTVHGWALNEERSFIALLIIRYSYIITLFLSYKIIAVSENIAMNTPFYFRFKKKIHIIHNGVSEINFLEKNLAKEALFKGKFKNDFVIGAIGELHKNKGFNYLIESISDLRNEFPELRLVILGEGEERKNLEKLVKNKKLEQNVFLLGYIDEVIKYFKAFNILISSSITEALGYVLLEAGLAQIPVIATKVGGIPEIIENGLTGILVIPRSPEKMAEKIKFLIQNERQRETLTQGLYKKVLRDFSLERMIKEIENLYRKN